MGGRGGIGQKKWAILERNQKGMGRGWWKDILFLKNLLEVLGFLLYPWNFRTKQSFTPGNSAKLCYTPWRFQCQKPRPVEVPHEFFLISPRDSILFLINHWTFRMLFLQYPWGFHIFASPLPCLLFYWKSPIQIKNKPAPYVIPGTLAKNGSSWSKVYDSRKKEKV